MRVGSLFSGIGGLDLGFERAGFEIAWQVEIDGYCRKVLAKHWPDVPKYEDVRDVGAANLEWVDVIVGGFPCQDISNAGKRAGITGERSGLWSEFYRMVCEVRPRYVVVENVAALLHRGIDRILGDLAEGGYDAEWQVLSAAAFGAPHLRNRVFIVAHAPVEGLQNGRGASVGQSPEKPQPERRSSEPDGASDVAHAGRAERGPGATEGCADGGWCSGALEWREGAVKAAPGGEDVAYTYRSGLFEQWRGVAVRAEQHAFKCRSWWGIEPPVGRVAHGVPKRVDRLRGLGNAVVPQVAQYVAECVKAHAEQTQDPGSQAVGSQ